MAKNAVLALAALFAVSSAHAGNLRFRYAVSNPVKMSSAKDARELAGWLQQKGYDIAGLSVRKNEIEVIIDEEGLAGLDAAGLKGRTIQVRSSNAPNAPDPKYYSPDRIVAHLNDLHAKYPDLTRIVQVGTSLQGRPIMAMLVSSQANAANPVSRPSIVFDGMHHAREIQTPHVVMDVADTLLAEYSTVAASKAIVDGWDLWLLPMLNVDGNNIVWTSDNMWRKNAHATGGKVHGVDINRNYPYRWGNCNGSSGSTSAEDYHGSAAASEPETVALMKLVEMAHPTAALSYHSYSELVLYPFGCQGALSGDNALEERVAGELSKLLPTDTGKSFYEPGAPWQILYAVDGDSMDWIHAQTGALAFTFEVNESFQPAWSLMAPTLAKHRNAWKHLLDRSSRNMLTLNVKDAKTGQASKAAVAINSIPHVQGEAAFSTSASGVYFKVLDPGTYVLNVSLADGRSTQVSVAMAGAPQTLEVTVP